MPTPPIALELFARVKTYAAQLAKDGLPRKTPLKPDATIIVFCQLFFQQFLEYAFHYEVTAVDGHAKMDAVRLRLAAQRDGAIGEEAIALIRSFEDLCDMWPDVLGFAYGGSSTEFRRFHTDYMPRLLTRVAAWAAAARLTSIAAAADDALREWSEATKRL